MRATLLTLALILTFFQGGEAQLRPGVEVRGGFALPLGELESEAASDGELAAGPSFDVHLAIPRRARSVILLGFTQSRFRCPESGCGVATGDFVSTSWSLGMRLALAGPTGPWLRAALLFDRSEWDFPVEGGVERRASSLALGGEAGAGFVLVLHDRVAVLPGVRYALVPTRFPFGRSWLAQRLQADLGVHLAF